MTWPFEYLLVGLEWTKQLIFPLRAVQSSFEKQFQTDLAALFRTYWLFPIILSFISQGIIFHLFGIDVFGHPEFSTIYLLLVCIRTFAGALTLYCVLLALCPRSNVGIVFVCYTIIVIYSPIVVWCEAQGTYIEYLMLLDTKAHGDSLVAGFNYFDKHGHEVLLNAVAKSKLPSVLTAALFLLSATIGVISNVLVAECLTQIFTIDRFRAYLSVCIAAFVTLFPTELFALAQEAIIFAYLPK